MAINHKQIFVLLFPVISICIAMVVIKSHSGDGLKETSSFQPLLLVMTMIENTLITYSLTILLVVLVSICVLGLEGLSNVSQIH